MHTHLITVVFRGSKCVSAFTQLPVEVEECVALGRETMTFANTHIHTQTTDIELGILLYVTYDIMHAVMVVELHVRIESISKPRHTVRVVFCDNCCSQTPQLS